MSEVASADRELQALLSLLETERASVLAVLMEQIRTFPDSRLQRLIDLAPSGSPAIHRLDLILAQRAVPTLQAAFLEWSAAGADLEAGTILVARTAYPRLETAEVRRELDELAGGLASTLPHGPLREQLRHLTGRMRDVYGFHGNEEDYYDPENSLINRVLERRTGLPISLSVVYMLLGKRLGLDIAGIALPGHFMVCLRAVPDAFYVDPFRGGTLLTLREVMGLVTAGGSAFRPEYLRPAAPLEIVRRMLSNLEVAYGNREDPERVELVRQYMAVLS